MVGVDLDSFCTRVVVTDIQGNLLFKQESETRIPDGRDLVLSRTLKAIHKAIDDSRIPRAAVKGIGIGHSGVIDVGKGLVSSYPPAGADGGMEKRTARDIPEREFACPASSRKRSGHRDS
jgi:predicted NBD/HSP70 family sugar kinase